MLWNNLTSFIPVSPGKAEMTSVDNPQAGEASGILAATRARASLLMPLLFSPLAEAKHQNSSWGASNAPVRSLSPETQGPLGPQYDGAGPPPHQRNKSTDRLRAQSSHPGPAFPLLSPVEYRNLGQKI